LSDRCGALHVGDILRGVNGVNVALLDIDQVTELIRGDPTTGETDYSIINKRGQTVFDPDIF